MAPVGRGSPQLSATETENSEASLRPFAVSMKVARQLLGDKARSEIYKRIADGRLIAVRDGKKTLVTTESIDAYLRALPRIKVKRYVRRKS